MTACFVTRRRSDWLGAALVFAASLALSAGAAAQTPPIRWTAAGHGDNVEALDISPDGTRLVSAGDDRTIKLWSYPGGVLQRTIVLPYDIDHQVTGLADVCFTPDGAMVAAAMTHYNAHTRVHFGRLWLFRVSDGETVRVMDGHTEAASSVDVSPDGQWIASSGEDGGKIWRLSDGALITALNGHPGQINRVRFSPAGDLLGAALDDGSVVFWRTSDWGVEHDIDAHGGGVNHLTFSPDGSLAASASWDRTARIWRTADGQLLHTLDTPGAALFAVAFSPNGQELAVGGSDRLIRLWDVANGTLLRELPNSGGTIDSLCYASNGAELLSGGGYPSTHIHVWDPANGSLARTMTAHASYVRKVAYSPNGEWIASAASYDFKVRMFAASDGRLEFSWDLGVWADDVAFSPDGQLIAMPGPDGTVDIRALADGSLVATVAGHSEEVTGIAFSNDGTLLATGSFFPGSICLWSTADWQLVRQIQDPQLFGPFISLTFSPDDTLLACTGESAPAVFRVSDGQLVATPPGISVGVEFSPDGQLLVIPGSVYQDDVDIRRVSDWALVRTLPTAGNSAAFSADGEYLYVAHIDAIRVWRTSDWTVVRTYSQELGYNGSARSVQSIATAPDGNGFAYGRFDATLVACRDPFGGVAGDLNCDGALDGADIEPFLLAIGDPDEYAAAFPDCDAQQADMNADGFVDGADIDPFFECLGGGNCP